MADVLNVSFLKGTQSKLNGLTSYQPGSRNILKIFNYRY